MIEGYCYITNEQSIDVACKKLVLDNFSSSIPKDLVPFIDYKKFVEEVLYCEIVVSNDRVIFISEEKLNNVKLS